MVQLFLGKTYTNKVDIWSLGVVLYIMLWGYRPFEGDTAEEVFHAVKHGDYSMKGKLWTKVSHDARDLVKMMLTIDPKKRISAKKALDHPWFGLIKDIKIESAVESEQRLDSKILKRLKVCY